MLKKLILISFLLSLSISLFGCLNDISIPTTTTTTTTSTSTSTTESTTTTTTDSTTSTTTTTTTTTSTSTSTTESTTTTTTDSTTSTTTTSTTTTSTTALQSFKVSAHIKAYGGGSWTLKFVLINSSSLGTASNFISNTLQNNIYKYDEIGGITLGNDYNFSISDVEPGTYYAFVYDFENLGATPPFVIENERIGTLGWSTAGTITIAGVTDNTSALWTSIISFEVSTADINLGEIILHEIQEP